MKEKLKELAKTTISVIIAILVISLLFWFLGGIVKFIVEGIDVNTTFNVSNEQKKYKYRIVFKNGNEANGNITGSNLDELKGFFLDDKANLLNQEKKLYYFNRDEIQYLQVEEIEEEQ